MVFVSFVVKRFNRRYNAAFRGALRLCVGLPTAKPGSDGINGARGFLV